MATANRPLPQRALLTGASGGIGRAIALELASHGLALLLVGRDPVTLASQCESLRHTGVELGWIDADLTCVDGRARLLAVAHEWRPDLVIHNAGASHFGWLGEQTDAQISQQLQQLVAQLGSFITLLQSIHGLILRFQAVSETLPLLDPARSAMEHALQRAGARAQAVRASGRGV